MKILFAAICLASLVAISAAGETINFEQFSQYQDLSTANVPGIQFQDFTAVMSPKPGATGLLSIPAHSGKMVAIQSCCDFPPVLTFTQPVNTFSGYFNYFSSNGLFGLQLLAYGANNQLITSVESPYLSNIDACDCPSGVYDPNELLSISSSTPIYSLQINPGDETGPYFTMDDITFTATPEPKAIGMMLLASVGFGVSCLVRRRKTRGHPLR